MSELGFPQMEASFGCRAFENDRMLIDTYTVFEGERVMSFEIVVEFHPEDDFESSVLLSRDQVQRLHALLGVALQASPGL